VERKKRARHRRRKVGKGNQDIRNDRRTEKLVGGEGEARGGKVKVQKSAWGGEKALGRGKARNRE